MSKSKSDSSREKLVLMASFLWKIRSELSMAVGRSELEIGFEERKVNLEAKYSLEWR